jgi:hypothetical protein
MIRPILIAALLGFLGEAALAQTRTRIWEVVFGTSVRELPSDFMLPACGTNGGPPSARLPSFEEFARCPREAQTGLHEIWFSYDDEIEYLQRALRAPPEVLGRYMTNQLFGHPVIFSLLVDESGAVRGFRVLSDPREDPSTRIDADVVAIPFRTSIFGASDWMCIDLLPREGEQPIGGPRGVFVKEICRKVVDGRHVTLETHSYLKPGQGEGPDRTPGPNEFEVRVRAEAIDAAVVRYSGRAP